MKKITISIFSIALISQTNFTMHRVALSAMRSAVTPQAIATISPIMAQASRQIQIKAAKPTAFEERRTGLNPEWRKQQDKENKVFFGFLHKIDSILHLDLPYDLRQTLDRNVEEYNLSTFTNAEFCKEATKLFLQSGDPIFNIKMSVYLGAFISFAVMFHLVDKAIAIAEYPDKKHSNT